MAFKDFDKFLRELDRAKPKVIFKLYGKKYVAPAETPMLTYLELDRVQQEHGDVAGETALCIVKHAPNILGEANYNDLLQAKISTFNLVLVCKYVLAAQSGDTSLDDIEDENADGDCVPLKKN